MTCMDGWMDGWVSVYVGGGEFEICGIWSMSLSFYEQVNDHRSYIRNLSSCEKKA